MSKSRPKHYADYADFTEVLPGVFYEPGAAVYIVDDEGEVVSWNADEWAEDPFAVTATVMAVAVAVHCGVEAVRENMQTRGELLQRLISRTYDEVTGGESDNPRSQ